MASEPSDVAATSSRFRLVDYWPIVIPAFLVSLLIAAGAPSKTPSGNHLSDSLSDGRWIITLLVTSASLVFAALMQPLQVRLVRALEGYWGGGRFRSALTAIGVEIQRRRVAGLERERLSLRVSNPDHRARIAAIEEELAHYPQQARLLPTALGNSLRATEDVAGQRYGLETTRLWPRLYPFLSTTLQTQLSNHRDQYDTSARFAVSLGLSSLFAAVLLAINGGWWRALILVGLSATVLAYRSAVEGARLYGVVLMTAFDLHRFDMLEGLRMSLPASPASEMANGAALSGFFAQESVNQQFPVDRYRHKRHSG